MGVFQSRSPYHDPPNGHGDGRRPPCGGGHKAPLKLVLRGRFFSRFPVGVGTSADLPRRGGDLNLPTGYVCALPRCGLVPGPPPPAHQPRRRGGGTHRFPNWGFFSGDPCRNKVQTRTGEFSLKKLFVRGIGRGSGVRPVGMGRDSCRAPTNARASNGRPLPSCGKYIPPARRHSGRPGYVPRGALWPAGFLQKIEAARSPIHWGKGFRLLSQPFPENERRRCKGPIRGGAGGPPPGVFVTGPPPFRIVSCINDHELRPRRRQ
jgi:hypothetical protein